MARLNVIAVLVTAAFGWACGGGEAAPASGGDDAVLDTVVAEDGSNDQSTQLLREVFTFTPGSRDPFTSLVTGEGSDLRPLPEDLRVLTIIYDPLVPTRSVAVVRDTTLNERYQIRVNDRVGRMLVTEIRRDEVVLTVENFGVPEQVILAVRRRDDQGRF